MKESEINKSKILNEKIYPSGYPNIKKSEPYLVPILNYFLQYLVFFCAKMGIKVKDQEVKDQVSTSFFGSPFWCKNLARSSWQSGVIPALVSVFSFRTHFFDFGPFLSTMPLRKKKTN